MCIRTFVSVVLFLLAPGVGVAQSDTTTQELQLNLEQFPDTQVSPEKKELELDLEQFDKTDNTTSDDGLELNLEQFDNNSQPAKDNNSNNFGITKKEQSDSPRFNFARIFLIGGLVLLVFYFISRRKKRVR